MFVFFNVFIAIHHQFIFSLFWSQNKLAFCLVQAVISTIQSGYIIFIETCCVSSVVLLILWIVKCEI